jgi:BlaI family penicillinase repressor
MKSVPKISESEWVIMKLLWTTSPQTANQIIKSIPKSYKWSPKTIKTLLNRLVKKNALNFKQIGKEYEYSPIITKSDCLKAEKKSIVNRLYDGEIKSMLISFIEEEKLTTEEINELTEMLKKKAGKNV